jgi:hypothetical protein
LTQTFLAFLTTRTSDPWYNNSWVVGIVTGVVSGALLALVTPIFLRRRRARDLAIRRDRAAEDALSALRPSVATGNLPSTSVVQAIVRACAFRRGLDPKQATPASNLLDTLVSEVMVSAFLAPDVRLSLSDKLVTLESALEREPVSTVGLKSEGDYKNATILASILGALALGAASAVSSTIKSWVPLAVVGIIGLVAFIIWQYGSRRLTSISIKPLQFSYVEGDYVKAKEIGEQLIAADEAVTTTSNGSDAGKQSSTSHGG